MSINEIIDQMESGLEVALPGPWAAHPDTMRAIIAHIRELEARAEAAEAENRLMLDAVTDFIAFHDLSAQAKRPDVYQKFLTRLRTALAAMEATDE